jgi:hypothetical protein
VSSERLELNQRIRECQTGGLSTLVDLPYSARLWGVRRTAGNNAVSYSRHTPWTPAVGVAVSKRGVRKRSHWNPGADSASPCEPQWLPNLPGPDTRTFADPVPQ